MPDVRREVRDRIRPAKSSPDEQEDQQPPAIGQSEIVAFSLVALLIISVVAVLYVARAFFLPTAAIS